MALPATRGSGTPVGRWDPVLYMDDMQQRMNQFMNSVFPQYDTASSAWTPLADVTETSSAYELDIDVPGVNRDDIAIELNGQDLAITGEFESNEEKEGHKRHSTRRSGRFEYEVRLPHSVERDQISAKLSNGVLQVSVPKAKADSPKRIEIDS